ncbi:MAG: hypothetical protein ABI231_10725 [Candidatus Tumulicola sp.]
MTAAITAVAVVIVLIAVAIGLYAWRARRAPRAPAAGSADWTNAAGAEFAGLSEPARCDLIFALAALDDRRSLRVLESALDDPSEAVALAAAHALTSRGEAPVVDRYFASNTGDRAARIAGTLALLAPEPP